jgi:beta-phosphoglucomutase-like phosphatase (HAD superfamily)
MTSCLDTVIFDFEGVLFDTEEMPIKKLLLKYIFRLGNTDFVKNFTSEREIALLHSQ